VASAHEREATEAVRKGSIGLEESKGKWGEMVRLGFENCGKVVGLRRVVWDVCGQRLVLLKEGNFEGRAIGINIYVVRCGDDFSWCCLEWRIVDFVDDLREHEIRARFRLRGLLGSLRHGLTFAVLVLRYVRTCYRHVASCREIV
jgi:hypothetical protein